MASLGMGGTSYPLTLEEIQNQIAPNRIGNYAYGYIKDNGHFGVMYVGRSDNDLQTRIKHGITDMATNPGHRYERFKFSYAANVKEAYEKECQNYHDFGGDSNLLFNEIHPAKPEGMDCVCPICGQ